MKVKTKLVGYCVEQDVRKWDSSYAHLRVRLFQACPYYESRIELGTDVVFQTDDSGGHRELWYGQRFEPSYNNSKDAEGMARAACLARAWEQATDVAREAHKNSGKPADEWDKVWVHYTLGSLKTPRYVLDPRISEWVKVDELRPRYWKRYIAFNERGYNRTHCSVWACGEEDAKRSVEKEAMRQEAYIPMDQNLKEIARWLEEGRPVSLARDGDKYPSPLELEEICRPPFAPVLEEVAS